MLRTGSHVIHKIAFVDISSPWSASSANSSPIGGTQSAIRFLAEELASRGIEVDVLTLTQEQSEINGVRYHNACNVSLSRLDEKDVIVVQGDCKLAATSIRRCAPTAQIYVWTQHDVDVDGIKKAFEEQMHIAAVDGFIFVSQWQMSRYQQHYGVPLGKSFVMQNAISKLLEDDLNQPIIQKERTLVYVSAPYRGLHLLRPLFSQIRNRLGTDVKLKVFSCFSRDHMPVMHNIDIHPLSSEEITHKYNSSHASHYDRFYASLYHDLSCCEGVEFYGSVPQNVLFDHMRRSVALFYPNIFPETCCTSVIEAFACGCRVISTDLGALSETTDGEADLCALRRDVSKTGGVIEYVMHPIPVSELDPEFILDFLQTTFNILETPNSQDNVAQVEQQREFVRKQCLWRHKADWFLKTIIAKVAA